MEEVTKAAELDSLSPEPQRRLGLLYEFDHDADAAVSHLEQATHLQPNRADYWADLGGACFAAGDEACAAKAYERAVQIAPQTPHYQWLAANYHLLAQHPSESSAHFRRFLELSSDDPTETFSVCLKGFQDTRLVWHLLPSGRPDTRFAYIYFLSINGHTEEAYEFWNEMAADGFNASFLAAKPYLEQLIASGSFVRAVQMWQYLQKIGSIRELKPLDSSGVIYNGGFEQELLDAGFDWRSQPEEFLTVDFADGNCYEGQHCLRVDFEAPQNSAYEPIYQIVPVESNREYLLTAHVRSLDITSDSGPRLRIIDPQCPACVSIESEGITGSTPWRQVSMRFSTTPHTQVIRLSVWRPRGRSFPMEIRGHFWLDSVSLHPISATSEIRAYP